MLVNPGRQMVLPWREFQSGPLRSCVRSHRLINLTALVRVSRLSSSQISMHTTCFKNSRRRRRIYKTIRKYDLLSFVRILKTLTKMKKEKTKTKKRCNSFLMIIHSSIIQEGRLRLPGNIVRKFDKDQLSDVAIIMVPTGTIWRVELRKAKGEIWFENGWQEFMDYYSIHVGHLLVFRYDGKSYFHVLIFDMSACEIEYPCHTKEFEESNHERVCRTPPTEESESVGILDVRSPCMTCATKIDECESQQTTKTMYLKPSSRFPFSRQHIAANKRKAKGLAKQNKSTPVEQNRCAKYAFNFKFEPEVLEIDSDSQSDDEPTMSTQLKSPSSRARDNCYSTKKIDTRTSLSPSTQYLGVQLNKRKHKRPKTDEVEAHDLQKESSRVKSSANRVNRRTEPVGHDLSLQEEASANVRSTRKPFSIAASIDRLKERAFEEARAFKSENPLCTIIMHPTYLYCAYHVNIPSDFARAYLAEKTRSVILQVSHGRTWHIGYVYGKTYNRLTTGWKKFVSDNHLKEGDVCVFELVDSKKFKMNVYVFRVL